MIISVKYRIEQLAALLAWFSGCLFLLLAFYMTIDTVSRAMGGPFTGVSDQVAAFVLALGGSWSLAHGLSNGSHVRVDVLTPLYPPTLRRWLNVLAYASLTAFATILAWQAWDLAWASWKLGALIPQSTVALPLALPQGLTGIGFSMLAVLGLLITLVEIVAPYEPPEHPSI